MTKGEAMRTLCISVLTLLVLGGCRGENQPADSGKTDALRVVNLRCEYRTDPLGIDVERPRLSWILEDGRRGRRQTAYRVLVASSPQGLAKDEGDLWDTGRVESDETTAVVYEGKPLRSGTECFWKVRVWDRDGRPCAWSEPSMWSMGLLEPGDWKAEWIGHDVEYQPIPNPDIIRQIRWIWSSPAAHLGTPPQQAYFRRTFTVPEDWIVSRADCWLTADDFVQLSLNGSKIRAFRNKKTLYEITLADYLRPGRNVLAVLGVNGGAGDSPAGLAVAVRIEAQDGRVLEFTTDDRWLAASEESADWQSAEFDDSNWKPASVLGTLGMAPWEATRPLTRILPPARYLRREFTVNDMPIRRAFLYTTALGIYQVFVNGERVSLDTLSPGWTDFRKRVYYRAYDVTDLLRSGPNAVGAILADGWYAGYVGGGMQRNHFGKKLRLLSQLQIEYADGTSQIVPTDRDWKASTGPIFCADLLQGEGYDARKEMPGWDTPGFDDSQWQAVTVGEAEVRPQVQAAPAPPVTVLETLRPVSVTEPVPGRYVFDMGQNFAGIIRLKVNGQSGHRIQIRHAERLKADGTIYTTNLRTAAATDTYICKGGGEEVWQPYFTYHGFQYVELSGLDERPGPDAVTGLAVGSEMPVAGTFECSDPMVNRLWSNAAWTMRMNFIDIPTDCPQRDERYGWTGDAQVYINTACYQNDVQAFFTKWLVDLIDAQRDDGQFPRYAPLKVNPSDGGPAWSDAGVICPWTLYRMYGDTRIIETCYPAMQKYIDFCKNRCTEDLLPPEKFHCFGDWLSINDETPHDVIHTAYFAWSTRLMAEMAEAIGKPEDAAAYRDLYERICAAFQTAYVQADGRIKGDTQAAYVLAIACGLLTADQQARAADHLVRRIDECGGRLSTGFVGTKDLMLVLSKIGRSDIAYKLLYNDTFPSWGFTIKHGATSIWERWNGWTPEEGFGDPGMNSFAHYSFGAVCQWIVENIGGIQTDGPGFKRIVIRPRPDGKLTYAKTSYRSIRGLIVSDWTDENGRFTLDVTIPPNTTATVYVPGEKAERVLESGKSAQEAEGVTLLCMDGRSAVFQVESGHYRFVSERGAFSGLVE